jgi:hypothetical protein
MNLYKVLPVLEKMLYRFNISTLPAVLIGQKH